MIKELIKLEDINANSLPELQGWKEKQISLLEENPFLEITNSATYFDAKKRRTALVKGRTTIQNQDKLIASKLKDFRSKVSDASKDLITITLEAEDRQQEEVKRYETFKELERQEKARLEELRKDKITEQIESMYINWVHFIEALTLVQFEEINIIEKLSEVDTVQFEEMEASWHNKTRMIVELFHETKQNLQIKEDQRLQNEHLERERVKFAKEKAEFEKEKEKNRVIEREKQDKIDAVNKLKQADIDLQAKKLAIEKSRIEGIEKERVLAEQKEKEKQQGVKQKKLAEKQEKARLKRVESLKPEKERLEGFINAISLPETDLKLKDTDCKKFLNHIQSEFKELKEVLIAKLITVK